MSGGHSLKGLVRDDATEDVCVAPHFVAYVIYRSLNRWITWLNKQFLETIDHGGRVKAECVGGHAFSGGVASKFFSDGRNICLLLPKITDQVQAEVGIDISRCKRPYLQQTVQCLDCSPMGDPVIDPIDRKRATDRRDHAEKDACKCQPVATVSTFCGCCGDEIGGQQRYAGQKSSEAAQSQTHQAVLHSSDHSVTSSYAQETASKRHHTERCGQ